MATSLPLLDALGPAATEAEIEAAAQELVRDARARAFCRETRAMLAENYLNEAAAQDGPRALALRWAAHGLQREP